MHLCVDFCSEEAVCCEIAASSLLSSGARDIKASIRLSPGFFSKAEAALRITAPISNSRVLNDIEKLRAVGAPPWLKPYLETLRPVIQNSRLSSVAIITPYAVSPAGVQGLSALSGSPATPVFACEAPVALAIELIAAGRVKPPANLLLLTPSHRGAELTAIMLNPAGEKLQLCVTGFIEMPGTDLQPDHLARWIAAADGSSTCNDIALYAVGPLADDPALMKVKNLDVQSASVSDLCFGAVRYSAVGNSNGTPFQKFEIERLAARPVGLLGAGRAGGGIWRQLFPAAASLQDETMQISAARNGTGGGAIVLAEIAAPTHGSFRWLSENDWDFPAEQEDSLALLVHATCWAAGASTAATLTVRRSKPRGKCIWKGNEYSVTWQ